MVFGFGKKKQKKAAPVDPIAAYDGLIEDLDRQAAAVRRSAATLLSLRGELGRDVERYERKVADIAARIAEARRRVDSRAEAILARDLKDASQMVDAGRQALASADDDARLLLDAASNLGNRTATLRAERSSARARLSVGLAVTGALKERSEKIDKVLALDAARDEVERAHALAEIYREEAKDK